jgi:hypothetical protein
VTDFGGAMDMERNVRTDWGSFILKGVALAIVYAVAYLALRYVSFNQWFLPAGLRAACLLFLPYRYWPFVILGEVGITLSQKLEMIEYYGRPWVYGSSILLAPITAASLLIVRKKIASMDGIAGRLPLVTFFIACWSVLVKTLLNHLLDGPKQPENLKAFGELLLGDYLGILTLLTAALLANIFWQERRFSDQLVRHTATSAGLIGALYLAIELSFAQNELLQLTMLMSMTVPAVMLTYYHGWKGAALGSLLASVAIAQTMIYTGIKDSHNEVVMYAQFGLILSSAVYLVLGSQITSQYEKAKTSGFAEQEALKLARMSLLSNEPVLRDQLLCMAQLQVLMDEERDQLAKALRANGKHREALHLNNQGMEHRQLFDEQALVLYPIGIEHDGLFNVLNTPTFRESRAAGTKVKLMFGKSDHRTLSSDLQVLTYRCVCHAIDHLSDWEPTDYQLYLRAVRGHSRRGLYVSVTIVTEFEQQATPHGESALLLLEARVKSSGGRLRRKPNGIRLWLSESANEPSAGIPGHRE